MESNKECSQILGKYRTIVRDIYDINLQRNWSFTSDILEKEIPDDGLATAGYFDSLNLHKSKIYIQSDTHLSSTFLSIHTQKSARPLSYYFYFILVSMKNNLATTLHLISQ